MEADALSARPAVPEPGVQVVALSLCDPLVILAGIKQFGLASDGADLRDLEAAIIRDTVRRQVLEGALEVFAKAGDNHGLQMPDAMFIDDYERDRSKPWTSLAGLRIGDLRRARAVLNQEPADTAPGSRGERAP